MDSIRLSTALSQRFEEFHTILLNLKEDYPSENILLTDFKLSKEEFLFLREICSPYTKRFKVPNSDIIESSWNKSDISTIICFLYAKYGIIKENRYWEFLSAWLAGKDRSYINLNQQEIYHYIKDFFCNYCLTLEKSRNNKDMMVNTFNTNAIIARSQANKLFDFFKDEVLHYPYEMDNEEIDEFLYTLIKSINFIKTHPKARHYDLSKFLSDKGYDFNISSISRLPKSFIHACSINDDLVFKKIKPIFIKVHREVLALDINSEVDIERIELEWYLEDEFLSFKSRLIEEKETFIDRLQNRCFKKAYRSPNFALDLENCSIQLYIPEQRVSSEFANKRITFVLTTSNTDKRYELEHFKISNNELLTYEKIIPLTNAFNVEKYKLLAGEEILKTGFFPDNMKILFFDSSNGNILSLNNLMGKDVYSIIEKTRKFESDTFIMQYTAKVSPYFIYFGHIMEETLFILDDEIISPNNNSIKVCSIDEKYKYKNVQLCTKDEETLPIYKDLPKIRLRSKDDISNSCDLLIINNRKVPYTVIRKIYIPDGSGDYLYEIEINTPEKMQLLNKVLKLIVNKQYQHPFVFVFIEALTYSFSKEYYCSPNDVRVTQLNFTGCDTIFSGHYVFPSKDKNVKFRVRMEDKEARLYLSYPKMLYKFENGEDVPQHIHIQQIAQRAIRVECSFEHCYLMYYLGSEKKPLTITGKHISSTEMIFDLQELRNNQSSEFQLFVVFGDLEKKYKEQIVTISSTFKILKDLAWDYYGGESSIRRKGYSGQYLSFSAVLDTTAQYSGIIRNKKDSNKMLKFEIDSNKRNQEIYISERSLSGNYSLEIYKEKHTLGMKNRNSTLVYNIPNIVLAKGRNLTIENLVSLTLRSNYNLYRKVSKRNKNNNTRSIHINNFFLEVISIDPKKERLKANGYFIFNSKKVFQKNHNPYELSKIQILEHDICFYIQDKYGQDLSISENGEVNKETGFNPYSTIRLKAQIVSGV